MGGLKRKSAPIMDRDTFPKHLFRHSDHSDNQPMAATVSIGDHSLGVQRAKKRATIIIMYIYTYIYIYIEAWMVHPALRDELSLQYASCFRFVVCTVLL